MTLCMNDPESMNALPEELARQTLAEAFEGSTVPEGAADLLLESRKPGNVLAIFYSGRSGSFFLQSFFMGHAYPRIVSLPPAALIGFETKIRTADMARFNSIPKDGSDTSGQEISDWIALVLSRLTALHHDDGLQGQAEGADTAPKTLFARLLKVQLTALGDRELGYEHLLKMLFIAHRLARGETLDCSAPDKLVYVWQAHVPLWHPKLQWPKDMDYLPRRQWLRNAFPGLKSVTVVRFPEKSLDSHLIHHAFEAVVPPLDTLLRRLLFEIGMAWSNEITGSEDDGTEVAVRFEDLHHHSEFVIRRICDWAGIAFDARMTRTEFTQSVRGKAVTGARKLTFSEMQPRLLSHLDVLKIRHLLQENYRLWGYDGMCADGFQKSLSEYADISRKVPFSCQCLLATLQGAPDGGAAEHALLAGMFEAERRRRDQGISLIPLLYDHRDLPAPDAQAPSPTRPD